MDVSSAIKERRSIRKFLNREVDISIIKKIIENGTFAPSACNRQAWRFIIVTEKNIKSRLSEKGGSPIILNSPLGVLVLYNRFTTNLEYPDYIESASACIQNMLLTALHFGLGSCWINHLPSKSFIRELFSIPRRYDIIAYVAFGYSDDKKGVVARKYSTVDELISYNKFEVQKEIEPRYLSRFAVRVLKLFLDLYYKSPKFLKAILSKVKQNIENEYFKPDHREFNNPE